MVVLGRLVGRWFGREDGEIMRAVEFITEYRSVEVGRVLDLTLTKNYPNYSVLDGKILDVSPKGKYKIQIVAAEVIPGRKATVKVGDTIAIDSYFLKQSLKESVINEVSAADLEQWNPERFQTQQEADPIGMISDKQSFSNRLPSCLDMPIKLPGTAIKNPYKNKGVVEFVQRSLQHNQKVNPRFDQSYVYLTVDQRMVEGNKTHRRGGAHFDGMQGERYKIKLPMDQNYIVSDYNPTHLYNQPFDARGLSTKHHNWFHELEKQVDKSRTFIPDPYVIYFVSGYHMHESPIAPETRMRTFMRISVGYKPGGLPGETPNPLLPTPRLNRDREIPANLKKDLKVAAAPDPSKIVAPSGSVDTLEEYWKKTLGAIGVSGALVGGGMSEPRTAPEVRPTAAATVARPENPDVSILAQTMWGEARSHGADGMLAVGNVIKNRAEANMKMFGQGIRGVALKPKQFSCWNAGDPNRDRIKKMLEYDRLISLRRSPDGTPFDEWFDEFEDSRDYMDYEAWLLAKDIAKKIISGRASDPTNGAVYYHTTDVNPSWNANLDHVATVDNHVFYTLPENLSEYKVDNVEGLGSVPYNQNVDYFGLRVMMKPSTFLSLALPLNEPRSVEHIMQHMKDGGALGAPFLDVKIPADWEEDDFTRPASISGHEGRNRMLAIQKLEGDDPVEVHLLLKDGWRARNLTSDMIKELQNGMMNQSRNRYVTGPLFSK